MLPELGCGGWVLAIVVGVPLYFVLLMALKVMGELLGIAFSKLLAPLFLVPKLLRWPVIVIAVLAILQDPSLPLWLQILMVTQATIIPAIFHRYFAGRISSFQADILNNVLGLYLMYQCFLQAQRWVENLVPQLLLTSLACAAPAYFLRSLHRVYTAYEKNQEQDILDAVARGAVLTVRTERVAAPFLLFLRGFRVSDRLGHRLVPELGNWPAEGGRFTSGNPVFLTDPSEGFAMLDDWTFSDLESVIGGSARSLGPMISLGWTEERRAIGIGRAKTADVDWKEIVAGLMAQAEYLFVIPVDSPGTVWEIEFLVSRGYLSKTIFIMPTRVARPAKEGSHLSPGALWKAAQLKLQETVSLPDYRLGGGLFMLGPAGEFLSVPGFWDLRGSKAVRETRKHLLLLIEACGAQGEGDRLKSGGNGGVSPRKVGASYAGEDRALY